MRWIAKSISSPASGPDSTKLAKQLRQARGKVERIGKRAANSNLLNARLELHVPPAGFARHGVQRLLVMFAGVTQPLSVPYALRLLFDESEDGSGDMPDHNNAVGGIDGSRAVSRR